MAEGNNEISQSLKWDFRSRSEPGTSRIRSISTTTRPWHSVINIIRQFLLLLWNLSSNIVTELLLLRIPDVSGSYICQKTDWTDWLFSWFFLDLEGDAGIPYIRPRPLPSTTSWVHYALTIIPFDTNNPNYWQRRKYTAHIKYEICLNLSSNFENQTSYEYHRPSHLAFILRWRAKMTYGRIVHSTKGFLRGQWRMDLNLSLVFGFQERRCADCWGYEVTAASVSDRSLATVHPDHWAFSRSDQTLPALPGSHGRCWQRCQGRYCRVPVAVPAQTVELFNGAR